MINWYKERCIELSITNYWWIAPTNKKGATEGFYHIRIEIGKVIVIYINQTRTLVLLSSWLSIGSQLGMSSFATILLLSYLRILEAVCNIGGFITVCWCLWAGVLKSNSYFLIEGVHPIFFFPILTNYRIICCF